MKTIKFYTKGKYMGFRKNNKKHLLECVNWIRSGNDIKISGILINDIEYLKLTLKQ